MTQPPKVISLRAVLLDPMIGLARDAFRGSAELEVVNLNAGVEYEGSIYYRAPKTKKPDWKEFLQKGTLSQLPSFESFSQAAALAVKARGRWVVFTFGQGRHLVDLDKCEPKFGLITALNLVKDDTLRSMDTHTFEDRTIHTRTQLSSKGSVDAFGIDVDRDIMRAVDGECKDLSICRSIGGCGPTLAITGNIDIAALGKCADSLVDAFSKTNYRVRFGWIDHLAEVRHKPLIAELDAELQRAIQSASLNHIHLAIPEPEDFMEVEHWLYEKNGIPQTELSVSSYAAACRPRQPLTIAAMKGDDSVWRKVVGQTFPNRVCSVYKCLVAEVTHKGLKYVLTNGSWFSLDQNFASDIEAKAGLIPHANIKLPMWNGTDSEGKYNDGVASSDPSILCLDRKLVHCFGGSSSVEVCDLLTSTKKLVHVKRRDKSSSGLSHLFMQGKNSSQLLKHEAKFVAGARAEVTKINPRFVGQFPASGIAPKDYEVVFALMGDTTAQLVPRLPFFSKLTLVNVFRELTDMGFNVSICGIPTPGQVSSGTPIPVAAKRFPAPTLPSRPGTAGAGLRVLSPNGSAPALRPKPNV